MHSGVTVDSRRLSAFSIVGLAIGVAVIVGLLLWRLGSGAPGAQPSQAEQVTQSPETTQGAGPTPDVSAIPDVSASPAASLTSTFAPEPSLAGEAPGPDATIPPGVPTIPDVDIGALVSVWAALGLACESSTGSFPGTEGGYNVHCERTDTPANVDVVANAVYWTPEGVQTISILFTPIGDDALDAAAAATQWIYPFADLIGGQAATAWIQEHVGDEACGESCTVVIGGSQLSYYSGRLGSQKFSIVAAPTT
jgi:hypothetical protein